MAGVLTVGLGLVAAIVGTILGSTAIANVGVAIVALGAWMLVASRR